MEQADPGAKAIVFSQFVNMLDVSNVLLSYVYVCMYCMYVLYVCMNVMYASLMFSVVVPLSDIGVPYSAGRRGLCENAWAHEYSAERQCKASFYIEYVCMYV